MKSGELTTIYKVFIKAVERYPDNTAFSYYRNGWNTLTYRDFAQGVVATAAYLLDAGLKPGRRTAIIAENRPEWCSAYLAITLAGGIAVPIDAQLGPGEIRTLLEDSEADIAFHSRKTVANIGEHLNKITAVAGRRIVLIDFDSPVYESLFHTEAGRTFPERSPDDIASIIYTSGTTGNPKGVMLTQRNFCSDAAALISAGIVSHEDNVLSVLPLHHTYAFMCTFLVPLFLGASITYPASLKGPDLLAAVRERGVSVLIAVPQLLAMIRSGIINKLKDLPRPVPWLLSGILRLSWFLRKKFDINIGRIFFTSAHRAFGPRFRFFGCGGAKLDPAVMKDLEALGFTVLEGYGLTETSPVATFNPVSKRKAGSAGRPLPSVEVRIANPSESGEGEIEIKGPLVMKGYYKNPAATSDVMDGEWLKTGDMGHVDGDGYLFITGRSKEVIVLSSGKNIYPEDVEKLYMSSPLIKEICVLGAGDDAAAESLHAVIVPDLEYAKKAKISNIQEEIKWGINEISATIPSYMRITGFSIRNGPLPRTPLGKLRRFMIKEDAMYPENSRKEEVTLEVPAADETAEKIAGEMKRFVKEGQKIGLDDNLELDLGLDSLSKIELVVAMERAFSLKLPENFLADIQTVRELLDQIRARTVSGYSPGTSGEIGWKDILAGEPSETDLRIISLEAPGSKMMPTRFAYFLVRCLFKSFFRLEVKGVDNLPQDGNFIITPNHTSYLDGFVLILSLSFPIFRNFYSLGLSEYFAGFLGSRFAKVAHVIPIDSSAYLNKALQMSAYVIRSGSSLLVFPEGGRSHDGSLLEFKKGVGILAIEMGIPVVPAYIGGSFEALPRGAILPRFRKIRVIFGKPLLENDIDFSKKPAGVDGYQYFANVLRERVRHLKKN